MNAKDMFKKLGYIQDKEPIYTSIVSFTKYCEDGCCKRNELAFYQNGIDCDECFISYELLQAINQQVKELKR